MSLDLQQSLMSRTGHSSDVRMWLDMDDQRFSVVQAGPDAIKLEDVSGVKPGDAFFNISVDGDVRRQPIRVLAEGWRGNWIAIKDR